MLFLSFGRKLDLTGRAKGGEAHPDENGLILLAYITDLKVHKALDQCFILNPGPSGIDQIHNSRRGNSLLRII